MARVLAAWAAGTQDAIDGLAAGLSAAAATGARMLGHFFLTLFGDALTRLGRLDEAAAVLEQARSETEATGERFFAPETLRLLAVVADLQGDPDAAARHQAAAVALTDSLGHLGLRERLRPSST